MIATPKEVKCRSCGQPILWTPVPTQREDEDALGPFSSVPDWIPNARISPPDAQGRTWLLATRKPGQRRSYWPADRCDACAAEGARAAAAWNRFMGR